MKNKEHIRYDAVQDIAAVNSRGMFHYPSHWHTSAEFVLALEDGCLYRIDNEEYRLSRGDMLLIWPRECHELLSVPENGTLFVQFSDSLLESNRDLAFALPFPVPLHRLSRAELPALTGTLAQMMQEIMSIYLSEDLFRETRCKLVVYQMLLLLAEHMSSAKIRQSESPDFSRETLAQIRKACAYIDDHYAEDLHQADVAGAVGLSSCYFSRTFRRYMQSSFPEYLARVRLHAAKQLLADSALSITECAYLAGFQSLTTFNRVFADMVHVTPRRFRRMYLEARHDPEPPEEEAI